MATSNSTISIQNHIASTPSTMLQSFGNLTGDALFSVQPGLNGVVALEKASCLFASALTMLNDLQDRGEAEYALGIHHLVDTGKAILDSVNLGLLQSKRRGSKTNSDDIIRNGFSAVTRCEVVNDLELSMSEICPVKTSLEAIERLAANDEAICGLARHARSMIDIVHNDLDVLRERAEKAGVVGELLPERPIPAVGVEV